MFISPINSFKSININSYTRSYVSGPVGRVKCPNFNIKTKPKINVILTENVSGVGEKGEEIKIRRGFARNYLYFRNLAVPANDFTRKEYEKFANKIDYKARSEEKRLKLLKKRISNIVIEIKRKLLVETNTPKNPVTIDNIIEKIEKRFSVRLKPDQIEGKSTLYNYGIFHFNVSLEGQSESIEVRVVPR